MPSPDRQRLNSIAVTDVWGIGRRLGRHLEEMGVRTALALSDLDPRTARQKFNVVVEKTVRELQGTPCISFDEIPPHPVNIMVSRGFKGKIKDYEHLREAVSLYAGMAAAKARGKKVYAGKVSLFLRHPFVEGRTSPAVVAVHAFPEPVNDTVAIIKAAFTCFDKIYKPGQIYQKAGIILTDLVYADERQTSLFGEQSRPSLDLAMQVMDGLNKRFGKETVRVASSGYKRPWWMARERLSPCYTTRWEDLPRVSIRGDRGNV